MTGIGLFLPRQLFLSTVLWAGELSVSILAIERAERLAVQVGWGKRVTRGP